VGEHRVHGGGLAVVEFTEEGRGQFVALAAFIDASQPCAGLGDQSRGLVAEAPREDQVAVDGDVEALDEAWDVPG